MDTRLEAYSCLGQIKDIVHDAGLFVEDRCDLPAIMIRELNSLGELGRKVRDYYNAYKDYAFARDASTINRSILLQLSGWYSLPEDTNRSIVDCERELLDIITDAGYYNEYNELTLSRISGNILFCKNEIQEDWREYTESMGNYSDPEKRKFDVSLVREMFQNIIGIRGYLYRICREIRSGDPVIPEFKNLVRAYVDFYNFWNDKYSMLNHVNWEMLYGPIKETIETISSFLPDKNWGDIQCDIFERAKEVKVEEVKVRHESSSKKESIKNLDKESYRQQTIENFKKQLKKSSAYSSAISAGKMKHDFIWCSTKIGLKRWLIDNELLPQKKSHLGNSYWPADKEQGNLDWECIDLVFTWDKKGKKFSYKDVRDAM